MTDQKKDNQQMKIIAYRGFSKEVPENTMEAFQAAILAGASGIQLDVHLTRDEEIVVFRDDAMVRLMDGVGFVRHHTLQDLQSYHFKDSTDEQNFHIPTLWEYLNWAKSLPHTTLICLRNEHFFYPSLEEKVIDMVEEFEMTDRVILTSQNVQSLEIIRTLRPDIGLAYPFNEGNVEEELQEIQSLDPSIILLKKTMLREEVMEKLIELGRPIYAYVVDGEATLSLCRKYSVEGLLTRHPLEIQELLAITNQYSEEILKNARLKPETEEEEKEEEETGSSSSQEKEKFFGGKKGKQHHRLKGGIVVSIIISVSVASIVTYIAMKFLEDFFKNVHL